MYKDIFMAYFVIKAMLVSIQQNLGKGWGGSALFGFCLLRIPIESLKLDQRVAPPYSS
jgi:hypothetical protein